eukprot:TRINITY_DN5848_c0_g1_i1.p1 TRINITY_DN5848_c0_g1~~TRINITY_DN5848_c0_g1_i1.p1  ORF type:complete len:337 (+),score=62.19 TRINITY_DN5848_c0_g1_i1:45-1055(+)
MMNGTFSDPIPLWVVMPWDRAYPDYYWYWIVEVIVCYGGSILNVLLIYVFSVKEKAQVVESREARALLLVIFCIDLSQGLYIGTVALASFIVKGFIGRHVFCSVHSFMIGTFSYFALGTMSLMSLHLLTRVTSPHKRLLPLKRLYALLILIWSILLPCLVFLPGGAILDSSGIVCVPQYQAIPTKIFFAVIVLMILFVAHIYLRIYLYYLRITQGTSASSISTKKKRLLVRFSLLIFISFGTLGPFATTLVYAWIADAYPSAYYEIVAMFFWIITILLNPLIYFYSNPNAWKVLLFKLHYSVHISQLSDSTKSKTDTQHGTTLGSLAEGGSKGEET